VTPVRSGYVGGVSTPGHSVPGHPGPISVAEDAYVRLQAHVIIRAPATGGAPTLWSRSPIHPIPRLTCGICEESDT